MIAARQLDQIEDLEVQSPAVLPSGAAQFSMRVDSRRIAREGMPFPAGPLPPELHGAAAVRRVQFLAGRCCATAALQRLHPNRPPAIVGRGERGVPLWPAGVVGSITHTDGFVSAAVAHAASVRGLGIDSEGIVSAEQAQSISSQVSWPSELAHAREAGLDRLQAMTLVFSAKEAIFKCLYPLIGAMFYYHDVRIIGVDAVARGFRARLVKTLSPEFPADTIVEGRFVLSASHVHTGVSLAAC